MKKLAFSTTTVLTSYNRQSKSKVLSFVALCCLIFGVSFTGNSQSIVWSSATGSQWMTGTHWTGNAVPTTSQVAEFDVNPTAASNSIGIAMSSSNNVATDNQGVGAIYVSGLRTNGIQIGNSTSSTAGTLTFTAGGETVNGSSNTIIYCNSGSASSLTLQASQSGGNTLNVAIAGSTAVNIYAGAGASASAIGNTIDITSVISGSAAVTFNGNGTFNGVSQAGNAGGLLQLGGANTYSGALTIGASNGTNSGILELDVANAVNDVSSLTIDSNSQLYLNVGSTGTFSTSGFTTTIGGLGNASSYTGSGAITTPSNAVYSWSGPIALAQVSEITVSGASGQLTLSGSLSSSTSSPILIKGGKGTLVLSGANTRLSIGTQIYNGTLTVNSGSLLGSGPLTMAQTSPNTTNLNLNNTAQSVSSLSSSWTATSGTIAQTITLGSGNTLTVNQTVNTIYGTGNASTLTAIIAGAGALTKSGTGTLTLTGANTYTGNTNVNGGSLYVNGSLASGSAVSVGSSGILGGSGTVAGSVSVAGAIAPGASSGASGTLTTGSVTFATGGTYTCNLNTAATGNGVSSGGTYGLELNKLSTGTIAAASGGTTIYLTGSPSDFSPSTIYNWVCATASSITGTFTVNTSNFTPTNAANGTFAASITGGNTLVITYTPAGLTTNISTVPAMSTTYGTASSPSSSFNLSGTGLSGAAITISAPNSNFLVSLSPSSGFASSVSLTTTNTSNYNGTTGVLASTPVYVEISAAASYGAVSGNVSISGGGTSGSINVAVSGFVIAAAPTTQASNIAFSNVTATSTNVSWTAGTGGTYYLVVVTPGNTVSPATNTPPTNGTDYASTANLNINSAAVYSTNNYVVYAGSGTGPITITGLIPNSPYSVQVYNYNEYSTNGATDNYLTTTTTLDPNYTTTLSGNFYWNGAAPTSGTNVTAAGGNGTWTTNNAWVTPTNPGEGATWVSGNAAIFPGTLASSATVTLGSAVSTTGLNFNYTSTTHDYTISGTPAITLAGSTPTIALTPTGTYAIAPTISTPLTAANQVQISTNSASIDPVLNLGAANTFTSGFEIMAPNPIRLNGNIAGAFGTSGNAGTITVDAPGTQITNLSGVTSGNTIYNNIVLNPSNASGFNVALGATAGNLLTYSGNISTSTNSTNTTDVYLGNSVATGNAGAGYTVFNGNNTYSGKTVFCATKNGYFQCGSGTALPSTTRFIYGNGGTSETYGVVDLNGQTITVGSIETNWGTTPTTTLGITNSSSTAATLTINGGALANNNATFAGIIGTNSISGVLTGTTNLGLTLSSSNTGALTLTGQNSYAGATQVNGGALYVNNANGISASSAVSVGANGTIGGNGGAAGTLSLTGTVSPGASGSGSVGNFTTGAQTWNSGAKYQFDITNVNGGSGNAGTNWDLLTSTGGINVSAGGYTIYLTGNPTGFSTYLSYNWTFATASSITGFNTSNFTVDYSNFTPAFNGNFTVTKSGNALQITFTPAVGPTYFWNGPTNSTAGNLTPGGGAGTWNTTNTNWVEPAVPGTGTTWADNNMAVIGGTTTGTVSIADGTTVNPTSTEFKLTNYVLTGNGTSTSTTIGGVISLDASVNLTLNDPTQTGNRILSVGSISGGAGSGITIGGAQSSGNNSRINLSQNNAVISVLVTIAGTGSSSAYAGIVGTAAATSVSGNISNSGTQPTMLGATGSDILTIGGNITGTAGVAFAAGTSGGTGTVVLNGTNTYSGQTDFNNSTSGLVQCGATNTLSPNSILNLGATSGNGGTLDLNGFNQTILGLSSGSGTGSITDNASGTTTNTLTINQSANTTFGLTIVDGGTRKIAVAKSGTGTLTITGTNNFTGGLILNAGEVQMGTAANLLANSLPFTFNGGAFATGITNGYNEAVGTILLTGNSIINLGTGSHTLKFNNSSSLSWTSGKTLIVTGWLGSIGTSGTAGQIFVGNNGSGLTTGQLAQIWFQGFAQGATQLSTGEVVPKTAITTVYSQGSGKAATDTIWSYQAVGTPQTITNLVTGGFSSGINIVIQTGDTVTTSSSQEIIANNLTISSGAELKEHTTSSATPYYINLYGNLVVNGKLGLNNGGDSLALNINGTNDTISGTGIINLQRIRTDIGSTNLVIGANVDLWWSGTSIYNNAASSTFNLTVNSGSTVDFEGVGDVSIAGAAGATANRGGTFTINGTMKGIDTVYGFANVATPAATGFVIGSGGLMGVDYALMGIGGTGNFGFAINTGGELNVNTVLQLQYGQFAPQGTVLMKSSSVNSVAIIDNFSSNTFTGTYSGQITAERYYSASETYNQHYMGSPVDAPLFSQFGATGTSGHVTDATCDETQLSSTSYYGSVFYMDQTNGATCPIQQWEVVTTGNAVDGQGYSVLIPGTGTLSLTGTPNLNPSYTVSSLANSNWTSYTSQHNIHNFPAGYHSGWQLLSNPYLATIQIASNPSGFDGEILVWNADGSNAGTYQPSNVIAPFQAFMVHVTSPTNGNDVSYTINAGSRVLTAQTFYDQSANQLNIVAQNVASGLTDQTAVGFNTSATDGFDPQLDADKLPGALNRHTLYTVNSSDQRWMSKNILNSISSTSEVPMGFEPGATGTYTLTFNGVNTFDPTSYIYLEDQALNIMYNARNGNYTFTADSADNWSRFVLHFTPPTQITTVDATCSNSGTINVQQQGPANWNYTITDSTNAIVTSGVLNQNQAISIGVAAGIYTLTLTDTNNYVAVKVIQVNGPQTINAAFNASATTVQAQQSITLTAATTNAESYLWNLGNGTTATGADATAVYTQPGVYTLSLIVTNNAGCSSTQTKTITVTGATGLTNVTGTGNLDIWSHDNNIFVDFTQMHSVDATVNIYDILGQQISSDHCSNNNVYQKVIDNIDAAYLIVMVKDGDKITTKKVFIANTK